ncbi:hypothetical protein BDL97_14G103800 [Sphagnum fallax]|nr:hypothetical protein BDL97_14G103800 [Sphagnum fallax]
MSLILEMQERLTKMRKNLQKSIDAYAVILVLLASITYIGFLQPPGSFDEGGLIGTSSRLRSFVYCNSFSFFFSITDLLLCVSGNPILNIEKTNNDDQLARSVVYRLMKLLGFNLLFVVSLICCMGAYISAGTVVQKLNIADQETILISSIIGSSLYIVFILLLLFLFTFPTLKFFSTCCKHGSSGGNGSQSQCWPWKNPCKGYLKKLEDKLLHNAPNLSEQQTATTPIEPSVGGDASGSTPIVQEIELVQTEQQRIGWCVNKILFIGNLIKFKILREIELHTNGYFLSFEIQQCSSDTVKFLCRWCVQCFTLQNAYSLKNNVLLLIFAYFNVQQHINFVKLCYNICSMEQATL